MTTKNNSMSRLSIVALGALLIGLPATAALAAGPATATEARALSQHYQQQADRYRALGGVGYKSGLVQTADADAAKYAALADQLSAPTAERPARSPEAEHYAQLAEQYRAMGGAAYKSGLVQRAEAQQRKYETTTPAPSNSVEPAPACATANKPAVRLLACAK